VLGPEMKSTGEVMGIDKKFGVAFAKSQIAAGNAWAPRGRVFISVNNHDKRDIVGIAKRLTGLGFTITATHGTAAVLRTSGLEIEELPKVQEGARPNVVDRMKNGDIAFLINTPSGRRYRPFEVSIRSTAVRLGIPLVTTLSGAAAVVLGLEEVARGPLGVRTLQEYQADLATAEAGK
jgi:carbamoyl-phosphate synthase large subunit